MKFPGLAVFTTILSGCMVIVPAFSDECPAFSLESLAGGKLLDLTYPLSSSTPYWPGPGYEPFSIDSLATMEEGKVFSQRYATPEHLGTHIDAPNHFHEGGLSVDQIPSRSLFGPAVVFDFTRQAGADADSLFTAGDLEKWEDKHGRVPEGSIALLRTGWSHRSGDPGAYQNRDAAGRLHFPAFALDAVQTLVRERGIAGIGIDTLSVDPGISSDFPVHIFLGKTGRYAIENLPDLGRLPPRGAVMIVAPMKILGGSGGQVRVFAILP
jgi:kynurenine formamidase